MYDQPTLSQLVEFTRVEPGWTVIDVYPGDGDWTRLFAGVVGSEGRVYGFVPAEVGEVKKDSVGIMQGLATNTDHANIEAASADLMAMAEVTQQADILWLHLFYHDLHTELIQKRGARPADFNRSVYERLKSGGYYVVVDHAGAAGTGARDVQSLHRIDPALVRKEVEAAGFKLDATTSILKNPEDAHAVSVFDPAIKGETDRFAYRFIKP
jgi:predicted methyltransferase